MHKDTVFRESIQRDIKDYYMQRTVKWDVVGTAVATAVFLILIIFLLNASEKSWLFFLCLFLIGLIVWSAVFGITLYHVFSMRNCMQNYTLVYDELCGTGRDWIYLPREGMVGLEKMHFKQYGTMTMHETVHSKLVPIMLYKWSMNFEMSSERLMEHSSVGDRFCLVIYKNKIIVPYNLKLFDMQN